jgi:septum site-determining protein MinD
MRIGRIFDIDIYISKYLLLLTAVLIIMGRSGNITAIFFIFLLHEMSHVLAARLLNLKVKEIELLPFGGAVRIQSLFELNPVHEIIVAAAGPFSNVLLPAAQTRDKNAVTPAQMQKLCEDLREQFDFILIDSPAGIEQGFKNAIAGADRAVVVTAPEVSAVRDADRIIGLLASNELLNPQLIVNRLRMDMVKRGDMMNIEDTIDILGIDLLGVVPDDEKIIVSSNRGEPVVMESSSLAGQAYRNIAKRLMGEEVPLIDMENEDTFIGRLRKFFSGRNKKKE